MRLHEVHRRLRGDDIMPTMCGLCGILGDSRHWSDAIAGENEPVAGWQRQRERQRRVALINVILAPCRVVVADWQGEKFLVRGPTGRAELAESLGDLWHKAEVVAGRPLDPLNPEFLEALDEA